MAEPNEQRKPARPSAARKPTGKREPQREPETYLGSPFGVPLFGVPGIEG